MKRGARRLLAKGGARVGACLSLGVAALALSACGGASSGGDGDLGTNAEVGGNEKPVASVTWGITADPVSIDPAYCFDFNCLLIVPNVNESLLRLDAQGNPTPNLASSWRYEDPRTLVLEIRKNVKFQDGNLMTIDDVVYSLERQTDPSVASYVGYLFESVESIKATGPSEVTIELTEPDSRFLPSLGTTAGAVVEKAWMEEQGKKAGTPAVGMVGTGPYEFVSWRKGEQVQLTRFDEYWNQDRPLKVERFSARILPDEATMIAGLESGAIEGAFESALSGVGMERLADSGKVDVSTVPGAGVTTLSYNLEKPPFDDIRVRQAMTLALDRQVILDAVWGGIGQTIKSASPQSLWSYGKEIFAKAYDSYPPVEQDLAKAKQLIAEAGAEGAEAELWVDASQPWQTTAGVAIEQAADSIGLKMSVKRVPFAQYAAASQNTGNGHPYNALILFAVADLIDPVGLLGFLYQSDALFNATAYDNPQVDAALKGSDAIVDPEKRAEAVAGAEEQIVAEGPATVLYAPDTVMVHSKEIGGYELRPLWSWDSFIADLSGN